jgi:hypothetical protein
MARVLDRTGILEDDWHPLDGVPAPDYVPPFWDGPHVSKRLIEALRTLTKLPMPGGPQKYGNGWPGMVIEFHELSQYADDEAWKTERRAEWNSRASKSRPSSTEITRMETAITWPARYLGELPQLLRAVRVATLCRMSDQDLDRAAHRVQLPPRLLRRWSREGLDIIAAGLRRDHVRVF